MKVIIAGSRTIRDYLIVEKAIKKSGFDVTEVISGGAPGVDRLGEKWARTNKVPIKQFLPAWKDLDVPGAVVKENQYGKYNAMAGFMRNEQMALYAENGGLIAIRKAGSPGTTNMIEFAEQYDLKVFIKDID